MNRKMYEVLKDANQICRSAKSIADRRGKETNWDAFTKRLGKALKLQHEILNSIESEDVESETGA